MRHICHCPRKCQSMRNALSWAGGSNLCGGATFKLSFFERDAAALTRRGTFDRFGKYVHFRAATAVPARTEHRRSRAWRIDFVRLAEQRDDLGFGFGQCHDCSPGCSRAYGSAYERIADRWILPQIKLTLATIWNAAAAFAALIFGHVGQRAFNPSRWDVCYSRQLSRSASADRASNHTQFA